MKKKLLVVNIAILSLGIGLVSCGNKTDKPIVPEPVETRDVFISEYYKGSGVYDYALEIHSETSDFSNLKVQVYSGINVRSEFTVELNSSLSTKTTIVFGNKDLTSLSDDVIDVKLDDNYFTDRHRVVLSDLDGNILDSIGYEGVDVTYIREGSNVKMETSLKPSSTYSELEWYKVRKNEGKYLGNIDTPLTYSTFIEGPKLEERYSEFAFSDGLIALGGFVEVTVDSYGDGDTTNFLYPAESGLSEKAEVYRTRYYLIDTPEIDHGPDSTIDAEPWGVAAQEFTNTRLKNAKHILVQSALGGSLHETYGRNLGFIWYTNEENPTLSDYRLVNYEVVLAGLASFDTHSTLDEMYTGDILYYSYLEFAYNKAKSEGIKIHGETDPDF